MQNRIATNYRVGNKEQVYFNRGLHTTGDHMYPMEIGKKCLSLSQLHI